MTIKLHDFFAIDPSFDDGAGGFTQPDDFGVVSALKSSTVAMPTAVPTQVLYLTEPGTGAAISASDINQGQLADCFLLSPIGDLAILQPSFISNMIQVNSNGTETVTLYEAGNGHLPSMGTTSFRSVTETVTNVFPGYAVNGGTTQDVVGSQKEIWPQVLEKAVAQLDGGYGAIADGGSPVIAMEELTGQSAAAVAPGMMTLAELTSLSAADDLLVFDSRASGRLTNGLVNDHAYMFDGITGSGAAAMVKLGNPWGVDQPTPILVSQLAKSFAEIDVGHFA